MTVTPMFPNVQPAVPRERVELILNQLDRLPTLPAAVGRLLAVTTSEESSIRDAIEIIESDAALTAAVLRMVRRADLGVRGQVVTVAHATKLLGFTALRNAVVSVQLYASFPSAREHERTAQQRKELWRHNLAVACVAEMIAARVDGPALSGVAFVCGLLHDIGKIALDACLPKSYARVLNRVQRRQTCICDVEQAILGLDHTAAGKRLVERWGLGQPIVECVWLHHQPPDALPSWVASPQLVRIVHLADELIRREGIGFSGYQYAGDAEALADQLGLSGPGLAEVIGQVPQKMAPITELLGLDKPDDRGQGSAALVQAYNRLSTLSAQLAQSSRRLKARSACLSALERFTGQVSERSGVGEVCAAAAESIRTLLDVERAVAVFREGASPCLHVGCSDANKRERQTSVIDVGEEPAALSMPSPGSIASRAGFAEAPAGCDALWERCCGLPASDPLWMLSLPVSDGAFAALMVAGAEKNVARFGAASDECRVLSETIGLALRSAATRRASEHMSEELLDLNRRLHAAQKELVHTRSISMIAAMAAGTAHELNNPLSVISGRAQMELAKAPDEEWTRSLKLIVEQTERATRIVTDLMNFAKPPPPRPLARPLLGVLESLCQHWRRSSALRPEQLAISVADPSVTVYADISQLREILDAVVENALQATEPETANVQINSPSRASDETARIVVEDNGVGMARDVLEHAFDPFFSSRPAGRGRGLGLSRAYRLAEVNGGRIWLESKPKAGTKVTIEIPTRAPAPQADA